MSAAVLEREETAVPCDGCEEIAEWQYVGDRAKHSFLCDHHYALWRAGVDDRPKHYIRLGARS